MRGSLRRFCLIATALLPLSAWAGTAVPFTINLSKPVNVVTSGGTPRIAVDVAGTTRYANYTSGSGTSALVFTYNMVAGDVDLDGVAVSSPVQLNGGTIKDLSGNPLTNLTFTPPNTAGVKVNYPSLGMDFTNGAGGRYTLNGTPYTTLASFLTAAGGSFTRASVGTYFDSAGTLQTASANTPRLDYDPVTHAAKGILIEEARTNLLTRSSEFENASWIKGNVTIAANAAIAPDGSMTADKLVENTVAAQHHILQSINTTAGTVTYSIYAKDSGSISRYLSVYPQGATSGYAEFNLGAGTRVNTGGSHYLSSGIVPVGNGWYRCSVTYTASTASTAAVIYISNSSSSPAANYTGDGTSGIYIWGAQLEQGAFPTSYIPTTTAAVTRAADNLRITTGGWFDATKGAIYAQGISSVNGGSQIIASVGSAAATDAMAISQTGTPSITFTGREGGTTYDGGLIPISLNASNKFAFTYNEGQSRGFSVNGSLTTSGLFGTGYGVSYLRLGIGQFPDAGPNGLWNGNIQKVKYYPARVPNTQLQLMTQ